MRTQQRLNRDATRSQILSRSLSICFLALALFATAYGQSAVNSADQAATPTIKITQVPPAAGGEDLMERIAGTGAAGNEGGWLGCGLSSLSGPTLLLIALIIALCLGAYEEQARRFISSMSELSGSLLIAWRDLLDRVLKAMCAWLKATPDEDQSQLKGQEIKGAYPVAALKGLLALVVASIGAWGNFNILVESVVVVFPLKSKAWLMALVLVVCAALVGFLLHSLKGRALRACLISLLLLLSATDGYLAYLRTLAIEDSIRLASAAEVVPENGGSLIIEGQDSSSPQAQPAALALDQTLNQGALRFSKDALLAALIALLCVISEALGVYGAFKLAGHALAWLVASPALIPIGLLYAVSKLAVDGKLAERLGAAAQAVISALGGIGTAVLKALASALRFAWGFLGRAPRRAYEIWQKLRTDRVRRDAERESLKVELQSKIGLASISHHHDSLRLETEGQWQINLATLEQERKFEARQAELAHHERAIAVARERELTEEAWKHKTREEETAHQQRLSTAARERELAEQEAARNEQQAVLNHLSEMSKALRDAVSESEAEMLKHLKEAFAQVSRETISEIVKETANKSEKHLKPASDSLVDAVSSLSRKAGEAVVATDGAHKHLSPRKWFNRWFNNNDNNNENDGGES